MLKVNDIYTVSVTDTTPLGAGVAKIDGMTLFVKGAVAGDEADVRITEVKKNYAYAVCESLVKLSDKRCDSDCPYFPACGGCTLRHANYSHECEVKENAVRHALSKMRVVPERFESIVSPAEYGYRNKVSYHFDRDGNVGFYGSDSHTLVKMTGVPCPTVPKLLSDIAQSVSDVIKAEGMTAPDELMLRLSTGGEVCAAFTGSLTDAEIGRLTMKLCGAFDEVSSIVARKNNKDRYRAVMGEKYITSTLCGLKFRISPEAFFQVNYEGAEMLISEVVRMAESCNFTRCADLYCGTGVIGMILASRFREARFTGVEINREAVADAKFNAKMNGLKNIDFYCGDAAGYADSESPELVVVDPPRKGLSGEMIDVLKMIGAERVIYVSCNPFTLARDAAKMVDAGYTVSEAVPVNMFPRSEHVETVVCLSREKADDYVRISVQTKDLKTSMN